MRKSRYSALTVILILCALFCVPLVACDPADSGMATITFDTGTDAAVAPLTAQVDSRIYPPVDPVRDGYRFNGWSLDGAPFVFDRMPSKDITLKAEWLKLYALSFDTGAETLYFTAGEQITLPEDPTKAHFKFAGWKNNGAAFTDTVMPEHDVSLKADWVAAYTITFNTGVGGLTVAPIVDVAGAAITAPTANRPGYWLSGWKLGNEAFDFAQMPSEDITLTAVWVKLTNLPSMFINLKDESGNKVALSDVGRIDYVDSTISLTNTKDEYIISNAAAGFRGRGNGSWNDVEEHPQYGKKRGYKLKFDKKQSLFGGEANKHWVILACTNFDDMTMSRNHLAYNMSRELFTAIEHTTLAEWVDIYINGEYHGLYLLCEHTRVGKGRVDIASEYSTAPENNGFLIEYDAYGDTPNPDKGDPQFVEGIHYFRVNGVKYPFSVHSPDPEDYEEEGVLTSDYRNQVKYIKNYVTEVYNAALTGNYAKFAELADVQSFVDMYILHELFKNVDTGYSSFYMYKKPNGKLYAGPPWDFDATTNINDRGDRTPTGIYVAGSIQEVNEGQCASELYISLYKNAGFKRDIKARWKTLSPQILEFLEGRMNDTVYNTNKAAMGKNFAKWKSKSQAQAETDWVNDMKTLKKWFTDRIAWLNGEWA